MIFLTHFVSFFSKIDLLLCDAKVTEIKKTQQKVTKMLKYISVLKSFFLDNSVYFLQKNLQISVFLVKLSKHRTNN